MNKRIIIGSVLVLTFLLLMPTIPAIQTNVVGAKILSKIPEDLEFDDFKELLESGKFNLESIKHPLLYLLVYSWLLFRGLRFEIIASFAYDVYECEWGFEFDVHYPLLTYRCIMLLITTGLLIYPFYVISDMLGWNWKFPW